MANYSTLIGTINAYIKRNGVGAITGNVLNGVMRAVVASLGAGYQFMGIASPQTDPGTPDSRQFYLAGAGTFNNFGDEVIIPEGALGIFTYDEGWSAGVLQIGSGGGGTENAVLYVAQTLDSGQKSQARSNIGAGTYSKPSGGIPSTDLASPVRSSLGKAESAVQPSDLEDVAYSGSYNDLKNKPSIPAEQVNSDWNASSGKAEILNKPSIPQNVVQYTSQSLTTEQKEQARTNIGAGTYSKPATGIPDSDLASGVQTSLGKADSAVQMSDLLALAETWTFTLDDDSVVTKKIIVLPNA